MMVSIFGFPQSMWFLQAITFYKSWPNLYALRGTPYRDIRGWANVIDMIMQEGAVALVGGHTRPIIGKDELTKRLPTIGMQYSFCLIRLLRALIRG